MKLGINNDVNSGRKKAALQLLEGGPSKINPPNICSSNPISQSRHGCAITVARFEKKMKTNFRKTPNEETLSEKTPQHEINKTVEIVNVVVVVALLFTASR